MIIHKIKQICKRLLNAEHSVKRLAQSTCLGIFIAFSPYIGLHTVMALTLCWLLSLNYAVTLAVQILINNPWTMLPIYSCDYVVGRAVSSMCNLDFLCQMPASLNRICEPLCSSIGMPSSSIWLFLIGGNVLSIFLAILLYQPVKWLFERVAHENNNSE